MTAVPAKLAAVAPGRRRPGQTVAPKAVRAWLQAHVAQDVDLAMASLTDDVVVAAGGQLFCGQAAAREWSRKEQRKARGAVSIRVVNRVDATIVTLQVQGGASARREVSYCLLLSGDRIRGVVSAA